MNRLKIYRDIFFFGINIAAMLFHRYETHNVILCALSGVLMIFFLMQTFKDIPPDDD